MVPPPPDVVQVPAVIKDAGQWTLKVRACARTCLRALKISAATGRYNGLYGERAAGWPARVRMEERRAEILSMRTTVDDKTEFFVHWDQFNKRLDEWIPQDRVLLTKELELPKPKQSKLPPAQGTPVNKQQSKGAPRNKKNGHLAAPSAAASPSPGPVRRRAR